MHHAGHEADRRFPVPPLQQRSVEINVAARLCHQERRRHCQRRSAHVSDHEPKSEPGCLSAHAQRLGQATALVQFDVDVLVTAHKFGQRMTVGARFVRRERQQIG